MINNILEIQRLLKFEDENEFYFVQVLQRSKENPGLGKNNNVIKAYYIYNHAQLEKLMDVEIMHLCEKFNARAYIHLNRRNSKVISFEMMKLLADNIKNGHFNQLHKLYNSVCGQHHSDKDKTWILDVDSDCEYFIELLISYVNEMTLPEGNKIIARISTKNGCHLISKPFDPREFGKVYTSIEIHKNNPTVLYIP